MESLILALLFVVTATAFNSGESSEEGPRPLPPGIPRPPGPQTPSPPSSECTGGWMRFERPNGVWCVMVGHSSTTNGSMSQQEAEAVCVRHGATLTGFQNDIERVTVAAEALEQVTALGKTIGGLWLGATNNPGCAVTSCGPYVTYRWTDGHTTGTAGFHWGNGEPDNVNWGATNCIQQFIMSQNFVVGPQDFPVWKTSFQHGDLDKFKCSSPAIPVTRSYACGKRGTPEEMNEILNF